MRTMLKITGEVARTNESVANGTLGPALQRLAERIQPEAAYFATVDGKRTAIYIFDLKDPADLAEISEPLFAAFHGTVEFIPVMSGDDLQRGLKAWASSQ